MYDNSMLSEFGSRSGGKVTWQEAKIRFPSPTLGTGPGEYSSIEELEKARKAVYWAREQAVNTDPGARFPTPRLGTGPGEFATLAELENAKKAIMWSRLKGQVGDAEQDRIKVFFYPHFSLILVFFF